ncbi:hypothetical protein ACWIGY_32610 [Streptomyces anulatus]
MRKSKPQSEKRRPTCADCGAKFTDDRWRAVSVARTGWLLPDP